MENLSLEERQKLARERLANLPPKTLELFKKEKKN